MMNIDFLLTSLVVVLIPGTGVIYTVSTGLLCGKRASIAAAAGCTMGILPHLLACVSGLSLILHTSAIAFQAVKFTGAVYLLYMAWTMWRQSGNLEFSSSYKKQKLIRIVIRGMLINILNPKLSIFFLAFLPQFITVEAVSPLMQMLFLSGIFMLLTLIIFIIYGIFAHSVRAYIVNSPKIMKYMQRSFSAVFAILGIKLALSDR